MNSKDKDFEQEYDSLKDVIDFQNNMFNPGHYVGTGKVPPTVSAPGNAKPLVIFYFFLSFVFLALGFLSLFSDVDICYIGSIKSPLANKIITLIIMLVISLFCLLLGCRYLKKAKKYHREKTKLQNEEIDKTVEDKIEQRICPKCGQSHDMDYPKCPNCKYNYLE